MQTVRRHRGWSAALPVLIAAGTVVAAACAAGQDRSALGPDADDLLRRIRGRTFPSVFQAWSGAEGVADASRLDTMARHDLVFHGPGGFGLRWDRKPSGLATGFTAESIRRALATRHTLLEKNPQIVLMAEIRYRDAASGYLPDDHPWWLRRDGRRVVGWAEGGFYQLDVANPAFRAHVAAQARAVVATGVVDGVMLDWWQENDDRVALVQAVREAIGPHALILVNTNDRQAPRSAPYVNGLFMECYRSRTAEDWRRIADTLTWAESHLREPRINCVETWYHTSRRDLPLVRATTALVLTHSDGYGLFSDPNPLPTPDHRHDWYAFWDKGLGRPTGPGQKRPDGAFLREFDCGWAVYNPRGNREVVVRLPTPATSRATGTRGSEHRVPAGDGDVFLGDRSGGEVVRARVRAGRQVEVRLGPQRTMLPAGRYGLKYFPDGCLAVIRTKPMYRVLMPAGVNTHLLEGDSMDGLDHRGKVLAPGEAGTFDNGYAGISACVRDADSGQLLAFYHGEDQEGMARLLNGVPGFYCCVALAVSDDDGVTFSRRGPVISGCLPKDPKGRGDQGCGEVCVLKEPSGRYLYAYYTDHSRLGGRGVQIRLARSRVSDRGRPGTWYKFHDGAFDEPGLGGKDTAVLAAPMPRADAGMPHVAWSAALGVYVMVFNVNAYGEIGGKAEPRQSGMYVAFSADGIAWSRPTQLWAALGLPAIDKPVTWHPTLVWSDARGTRGHIYYAYSERWGHHPPRVPHYLVGRSIEFARVNDGP